MPRQSVILICMKSLRYDNEQRCERAIIAPQGSYSRPVPTSQGETRAQMPVTQLCCAPTCRAFCDHSGASCHWFRGSAVKAGFESRGTAKSVASRRAPQLPLDRFFALSVRTELLRGAQSRAPCSANASTTRPILTFEQGLAVGWGIASSQARGGFESDPTSDLDGTDAAPTLATRAPAASQRPTTVTGTRRSASPCHSSTPPSRRAARRSR